MITPTTSTPHDAVFKTFLYHPETARDFLDIHLPASLRTLCDLDTLKLESESFIEADLRSRYSDVLWSLRTRDGDGYVYVVIEHQSSAAGNTDAVLSLLSKPVPVFTMLVGCVRRSCGGPATLCQHISAGGYHGGAG